MATLRTDIPSAWLLAAAGLAFFTASPLRANTVLLNGRMNTTADLSDRFVVHVPIQVPYMTVRVPIPNPDRGCSGSLDESVSVGALSVVSDVAPDQARDIRDDAGNVYRELLYRHPRPGDFTIEAKFGRLRVETDLARSLPQARLPLNGIPAQIAPYLQPTKLVESDDPALKALAAQITDGDRDEAAAAASIGYWLQQHIRYNGYDGGLKTDAISTLRRKEALCEGWSHLFLALARASGIPARFVGGYTLGGSITYPCSTDGAASYVITCPVLAHAWVEVWYPGAGWTPYDPQGSAGFVDTHHVRVWAGVDADGNLPLLTWDAFNPWNMPFSFVERQSASNVEDRIEVVYAGNTGGADRPVLLSRTSQ